MMHAMLAAVFVSTSALFFGLAFILLRKTRIGAGRLGEPLATFLALVWTMLSAFAIVELTNFALDWKAEIAELGAGFVLGLGLACAASTAATGWLVHRSLQPTAFRPNRPEPAFPLSRAH